MYKCNFKNGATITVFVPYDCKNNCPFCVNKAEYQAHCNFDKNKTISALSTLMHITPNCDIVFTGGEPFEDIYTLDVMLGYIEWQNNAGHNHKVFINTTLPTHKYNEKALARIINEHSKIITGLNVSRHVRPYVKECDDSIFDLLEVPVRINTVLFDEDEIDGIKKIIKRFKDKKAVVGFQIRENYTTTTPENLYLMEQGLFPKVKALFPQEKMLFSNNFRWNCQLDDNVTYHRTLPYSTIVKDGIAEINDIIINQEGDILNDWNGYGKPLNITEYAKCFKIKREPLLP